MPTGSWGSILLAKWSECKSDVSRAWMYHPPGRWRRSSASLTSLPSGLLWSCSKKCFYFSPKNHFFYPLTSIKETSLCEINDDFLYHLFLIHRGFMFVKTSSERREAVMSSQPAGETVLHIFSRPVSLMENLHTHKVNPEVSNLWRIC